VLSLGLDIGGSSAKAAVLDASGAVAWQATSHRYSRPSRSQVMNALRDLLRNVPSDVSPAGLCVPGLLNADRTAIEKSINLPGLAGVRLDELVADALHGGRPALTLTSDAHAAAFDVWATELPRPTGRMVCLSLGTGVGACVLDDGVPLHVSGTSPGHIGQLDVSLGVGEVPVGPDGGRGSLEAYIGLRALVGAPDTHPGWSLATITADSPPLLALARALRICHAIYRPQHIRLLGGVGVRIAHALPALRERVAHELTSVARDGWTLDAGTTPYHAARGAARLALRANAKQDEPAAQAEESR
jgi:predicted NBD/HSP70 family sugar kinase